MTETYEPEGMSTTRAGQPWTTAECRRLVEQVRAGKQVMELAAEFGRTDGGIRSRCHLLLPPERRAEANSKRLAVQLLGIELYNDPDYDWEQHLRTQAAAADRLYWSEAMDSALLEGWQRGASWDELTAATGATEREVAQRLKRRGIVASQQTIVDRIGPMGYSQSRTEPADLEPSPLWVLVISGLRGQPPHVSLHTRRAGAEQTLTDVTDEHLAEGGRAEELDITIITRTPNTA